MERQSIANREQQQEVINQPGSFTAFVNNLSKRVSRKALWDLFSYYGKPSMYRRGEIWVWIVFGNGRDYSSSYAHPRVTSEHKVFRDSTRDNRSYKSALLGKPKKVFYSPIKNTKVGVSDPKIKPHKDSLLDFDIPAQEMSWLNCCLVGVVKNRFSSNFIQSAMDSKGLNVEISRWGNGCESVLVIFESKHALDLAWSQSREAISYWFDVADPLIMGDRWGYFMALDEETRCKSRFDIVNHGKSDSEIETEAVWELSNVLGISFSGGKEAVIHRLCEIEEVLRNGICGMGIGRLEKVSAVRSLVRSIKHVIVFFQETKLQSLKPNFCTSIWCSYEVEVVFSPSLGSAGRLLTGLDPKFFKADKCVVLQRAIVITSQIIRNGFKYCFVNIYGPFVEAERGVFFSELSNILKNIDVPLCIGGDFNAYLRLEEKVGLLVNRLDRFLISTDFSMEFLNVLQKCLGKSLSDHSVVLHFVEEKDWGSKPFKCFNHWYDGESFAATIKNSMLQVGQCRRRVGIGELLKGSKLAIQNRASLDRRDLPKLISDLEKMIGVLEHKLFQNPTDKVSFLELSAARSDLWKAHREEERFWMQNSRVRWCAEGDRNTRFCHCMVSARNRTNTIMSINQGGCLISCPVLVKQAIFEHFRLAYNNRVSLEVKDLKLDFSKLDVD
ncbi:hypothetical protein V6N12_050201 [Hibiscus sabdariffa]|uniref:Endonuclease/exonuclease/phosphatase domain-containing protein n=1 Tax=Hibiscus sabdariffa TaxID=183260 RepID=A0ABR2GCA0_9ROSI